jgi:flavorubredoxin
MALSNEHAALQARNTGGNPGDVTVLADGKLYALQHRYALDGRVSSYPASARGFSVANSYLLTERSGAMLIDTGFGKDETAIRSQIASLIAPRLPLSLFPLRLNEFMSINNVEVLTRHFNVAQCYTSNTDAALWFDFGASASSRKILNTLPITAVTRADTIELGGEGRAIAVLQAPVRLIATRWLYDQATRTLFTSDMFTHVWRTCAEGPWVVTEADDATQARDLRSCLLNTRYWWLEGAPTDSIRRGIDEVFARYDVETIAPGYGCILCGSSVVARHVALLDEVLKAMDRSVATSRYVGRDEER